ncbi:MAG: hypothetical protein H7Y60_13490 [Rhodospirillaceae bacterium]|nr:hypothetical protein [Rhodospirillales bacterium]
MATGGKRIIIIEPGLRDMMGHYFNVSYLLVEECRRRGLPCVVYANREVSQQVIDAFPVEVVPFFILGTYFGTSQDPLSGEVENFDQVGKCFLVDLARLTSRVSAGDILIVPTASERIIVSFAQWLASVPVDWRPRVVLSFSFDPFGVDDPLLVHTLRMLYRAGFNALNASPARDWITLVTNSALDEYVRLAQRPVDPVPIAQPSEFLVERCGRAPQPGQRTSVAVLGNAVVRKGFHLLPAIIRRLIDDQIPVRFEIQVYGYGPGGGPAVELQPIAHELDALAQSHPDMVTLLKGPLSIFGYHDVLGAAEIILAAYAPEYDQISGVYHEAVAFGKAVVTRDGSAIAASARDHGAAMVAFTEYTAESIAAAIAQAVAQIGPLLEQAQKPAAEWRKTTGTGPYLDRILDYCARDEQALSLIQAGLPAASAASAVWGYHMVSPKHLLAVREALWTLPHAVEAQKVLDLALCHLERNTGALTLDAGAMAKCLGLDLHVVEAMLAELVGLNILLRRGRDAVGNRPAVPERLVINPHLAWFGSLFVREDDSAAGPPPLNR